MRTLRVQRNAAYTAKFYGVKKMLDFFDCIRKIQSIVMKSVAPALRAKGFFKTDVFILMSVYHKKSVRMTDLSRMTDVPASTLTGNVDRLVERGLIIRENDPGDRRSVLLKGTEELNTTVSGMMRAFNRILSDLLKDVPKEILDQTVANLNRIYELIDKKDACSF